MIGAAFLAGLVTFLSPCVLPLIPSYITYISGVSFEELRAGMAGRARRLAFTHSLAFILGFSLVFIALGLTATALGQTLTTHYRWLTRLGGALIVIFGIFLMGLLKLPWLQQEKRFHFRDKPAGYLGSLLVGAAFAAGWTPCVGPILSTILVIAAGEQTVRKGVILLGAYSLGLALPFLLASLAFSWFLATYQRVRRYLRWIEVFAGVLLIIIGISLLTDQFTRLTNSLLAIFSPWTRWLGTLGT
ncbi:MAG: sulfite exporter TauE/SafE family protein [Elusimicrobia bacterium]|nr:sulfite exporter TauE/SafE family protein [Elusimicrobiota bacterium]